MTTMFSLLRRSGSAWARRDISAVCRCSTSTTADPAGSSKDFPLPPWNPPEGRDIGITVYNSLTRSVVPFHVPHYKDLSWYMCGPTVYDSTHIGHAHCYMKFDIIRQVLKNIFGVRTRMVVNFTDIDDKVIAKSKSLNVPVKELAMKYENEFLESLDALQIERASQYMRVTDYVPEIAAYIRDLLVKGYAYHSSTGDINFDLLRFHQDHHGGKLNPAAFKSSDAIKPGAGKRHSGDFALWKRSRSPDEPGWDMSWEGVGVVRGRPGWHIECSTLAKIAFGDHIHIHSGGNDLRFPHHENEIMQSEAYHDCSQWVDYFWHSGHLRVDGTKMSKSLGNFVTVDDFLQSHSPDHFRMLCMLTHYRSDCEYSEEELSIAMAALQRFFSFHLSVDAYVDGKHGRTAIDSSRILRSLEDTERNIVACVSRNFNTCSALQELESFVYVVNEELKGNSESSDGREEKTRHYSPGTAIAAHSFVRHTLSNFGFKVEFMQDLASRGVAATGSEANYQALAHTIDEFMAFRTNVRDLAIGRREALEGLSDLLKAHYGDTKTEKQLRKEYTKITAPLLQASDMLRETLKAKGDVIIADHGVESQWEVLQRDTVGRVQKGLAKSDTSDPTEQ